MSTQIIQRDGKPEWAIVPYETYLELIEQAEMLQDVQDYDAIKAALERGEEELIPSEVVYAILDGANPVKVWRNYRGLGQKELAEKAGISVPYLSQLETGKRKGSVEALNAIARALSLSLDDLVAG
jgi:DNA-binding XRE family transcriptional regulator